MAMVEDLYASYYTVVAELTGNRGNIIMLKAHKVGKSLLFKYK